MKADFKKINIDTFEGMIPAGYDLVVVDENDKTFDDAVVLYGFDEVGEFEDNINKPIYGFLKFS